MSADLRRFRYPLESLLQRRRWQLDAARARLGHVLAEIEEAERGLDERRLQYQRAGESAASSLAQRLDPCTHPRAIAWLARFRHEIVAAEQALSELGAERTRAAAECLTKNRKLELLERHREECLDEFRGEEERRVATEGDREWLSRRSWKTASGGPRA